MEIDQKGLSIYLDWKDGMFGDGNLNEAAKKEANVFVDGSCFDLNEELQLLEQLNNQANGNNDAEKSSHKQLVNQLSDAFYKKAALYDRLAVQVGKQQISFDRAINTLSNKTDVLKQLEVSLIGVNEEYNKKTLVKFYKRIAHQNNHTIDSIPGGKTDAKQRNH